MRKITKASVHIIRDNQLKLQAFICPLCKEVIKNEDAVLDHDHKTGQNRAVLHRGCNAALGKIENARSINNLNDDEKFRKWCTNIPDYLKNNKMDSFHWTHKTDAEKKVAKSKKAKKAYKKRKEGLLSSNLMLLNTGDQ